MNRIRRKRRRRGCLFVIIIILLIIFALSEAPGKLSEFFFPRDYDNYVKQVCDTYDIDHCLVMAIIREESNFDPNAQSVAGACGLMQLMPDTAMWVAEQAQMEISESDLFVPHHNINIGIWYIRWLIDEHYNENMMAAVVAAYNAGHSTVDSWINNGTWNGSWESLETVPYQETKEYLNRVKRSWEMYKNIYTLEG